MDLMAVEFDLIAIAGDSEVLDPSVLDMSYALDFDLTAEGLPSFGGDGEESNVPRAMLDLG